MPVGKRQLLNLYDEYRGDNFMIRIIDSRSNGKTSRLFLLAKENGYPIICHNPKAFEEKAHRYGIVGLKFYSYSDVLDKKIEENNVLIDELESFVQRILGENNNALCKGYCLSID